MPPPANRVARLHSSKRLPVLALALGLAVVAGLAQKEPFSRRKVLGTSDQVSESLDRIVKGFLNPGIASIPLRPAGPVACPAVTSWKYFFRLTERRFVLKQDPTGREVFNPDAWLGSRPYVFMTLPDGIQDRNLYGILGDLGYDAESILEARGKDLVGVILRYPEGIGISPDCDGIRGEDFADFVYVPTWENGFDLLSLLSASAKVGGCGFQPSQLCFDSAQDRDLAEFFPLQRRKRIADLPYPILRSVGGPDWQYRSLMDTHLGMNPHFRGIGITENTLSPADSRKGLLEFVGPNRRLKDLEEFAVIDLGRLEFAEVHR